MSTTKATKEDVRITKSKRDLKNALLHLLSTKPFNQISVIDICDDAMINRMTFYKHYRDKYALLDDCVYSIRSELYHKCVNQFPDGYLKNSPIEFCTALLSAIIEECVKYRQIINSIMIEDNSFLYTIIMNTVHDGANFVLEDIARYHKPKYDMKSLTAIVSGASSNLIFEWIMDDKPETKQHFFDNVTRFLNDLFKTNLMFENMI